MIKKLCRKKIPITFSQGCTQDFNDSEKRENSGMEETGFLTPTPGLWENVHNVYVSMTSMMLWYECWWYQLSTYTYMISV